MTVSLAALLTESAARYPDRCAVVDPQDKRSVTFAELDALAELVARHLAAAGVSSGDRVGIYGRKSVATVAGLFGVLKAGGAYVPADPLAPASRAATVFEDCSVKVVLGDPDLAQRLASAYAGVRLETFAGPGGLILLRPSWPSSMAAGSAPAGLSYILYTSGSTGKPKGVMHTHASALSFVDWCSEAFAPTESDRFSSHAPFHFDLSILDIFLSVKHGATLVLLGEALGKVPQRLSEVAAATGISIWYSTPSVLRALLDYGHLERLDWSALRLVLFAGEVFPLKHLQRLKQVWHRPGYYNLYGPTETNVCTYFEVPATIPLDRVDPFPIGRPCSGDRCRVMDGDRDVGVGELGELLVTGGSVTLGYWNSPDRTDRAFYVDSEGIRWYRTGDIVRQEQSGDYIYIGRADRMVKRRGYRVELGEIEATLHRHPRVREAAAVAKRGPDADLIVIAFVVTDEARPATTLELKRWCAENLPAYMIPDEFRLVQGLPKTSTDKTDYQSLSTSA